MKNYKSNGNTPIVTLTADAASGAGVLTGAMFGVAQSAGIIGDTIAVVRTGEFDLPKLEAQAWVQGAVVYWDDGNSRCTTVATGNTKVGFAGAAAANPSATGAVILSGA